jgi:uncharacterized zinc-type alcohol dehydrogenase-like protein
MHNFVFFFSVVEFRLTHSGVCHSDLHTLKGEWGPFEGPLVAGHELLGVVTAKGVNVTKFNIGDRVGVGPQALSCGSCKTCDIGHTTYCQNGFVGTYNATLPSGHRTIGVRDFEWRRFIFLLSVYLTCWRRLKQGYSVYNRTHQRFVFKIPENLHSAATAPLLCAGVTVFTPLKYAGVKAGDKVAVIGTHNLTRHPRHHPNTGGNPLLTIGVSHCYFLVSGLGGLGHCAVKFAAAMGAEVTVISTSASKEAEARAMGATGFLLSTAEGFLKVNERSFDTVLNTTAAEVDYNVRLE